MRPNTTRRLYCNKKEPGIQQAVRISRERFASTVKRDKVHNATEADLDLIRDGNDYFHGGNCVLDVEIWQAKGDRRDIETFQYLYGMSPNLVGRILSKETIDAPNQVPRIKNP